MSAKLLDGTVHKTPSYFLEHLFDVSETWNSLTPLARNEWICWVESAKKTETKEKRLHQMQQNLINGKRRPCCWPGCPHRIKNKK